MERHPLWRAAFWAVLGIPLGGWGAPAAPEFDACLRRLADPDFETREAAYRRILDWGAEDPEGTFRLLPESHDDPDIEIRCADLRRRVSWEGRYRKVAAHAGEHADLAETARFLFPAPTREAVSRLVEVAGGRKGPAARMLIELLQQEAFGVPPPGPLDHPETKEAETVLPSDPDAAARRMVIEALGRLEQPSAVPYLVRVAEDSGRAWTVREAATGAVLLADETAGLRLVDLGLADPDPGRRQAFIRLLNLRPACRKGTARLRRLWESPDEAEGVRAQALNMLLVREDGAGRSALVGKALTDRHPRVREGALRGGFNAGIFRRDREAWGGRIAPLLEDPDVMVRCAAADSLGVVLGWWKSSGGGSERIEEARGLWKARQDGAGRSSR